ncbi:hypothetical protein V6N12_014777 [Hibiscus sabdariffa]|uniref:Uncharacterized protein n=1 Tax=Hibiscus sabdariffa TaxID=183260 RepID=A0ABR2DL78_9ROSI
MYSLCCVSKSLNGSDKTDFLVSKVVSDRASKLIGQNGQSFRLSQRRKSSLRRMRASNPSLFGVLKASGTLMSDLNVDSSRCSANILVIEPDICDKEKGAIVTLELSTSREWLLVVKKDGSTKTEPFSRIFTRNVLSVTLDLQLLRLSLWAVPGVQDEEWLMKFNNELFPGNGHCEHLFSEGCFELIVDAFEKEAYLRSLDDNSNEEVAAAHRLDLASS